MERKEMDRFKVIKENESPHRRVKNRKGGLDRVFSFPRGIPWWSLSFLLFLLLPFSTHAQDGAKLFRSNCASCHEPTEKDLVGPGLKGITEKREMDWLLEWTKNSQALIEDGDEQALEVYEEYDQQVMPAQNLSEEEIRAIYAFIESGGKQADEAEAASDGEGEKKKHQAPMHISMKMTLYWLALMALVVVLPAILAVDGALKVLKADKGDGSFR